MLAQADLNLGRVFLFLAWAIELLRCYMVKPHGQLVRVSFTHYCASTSRLSTSWSTTDLEAS